MGRPSSYKSEYDEQALKLCRLGATDVELADFFDVAESTLNLWKKAHPTFSESLKSGKMLADAEVANKLYQRAIGYEHPEQKVFNNQGEILTHDTVKHYAPDPTAAIFWLKNRQGAKWADRQHIENKTAVVDKSELDW